MNVKVNAIASPPIPERCGPDMLGLIESCWAGDSSARPDFAGVVVELQYIQNAAAENGFSYIP